MPEHGSLSIMPRKRQAGPGFGAEAILGLRNGTTVCHLCRERGRSGSEKLRGGKGGGPSKRMLLFRYHENVSKKLNV